MREDTGERILDSIEQSKVEGIKKVIDSATKRGNYATLTHIDEHGKVHEWFAKIEIEGDPGSAGDLTFEAAKIRELEDVEGIPELIALGELEDGRKAIFYKKIQEASSLEDRIETLPQSEAVDIILEASGIVKSLLDRGIYHWNIKPDHILITIGDKVYLVGFGLAFKGREEFEQRRCNESGTFRYMSASRLRYLLVPAQSSGFSHKDEVYSLGVSLAQALGVSLKNVEQWQIVVAHSKLPKDIIKQLEEKEKSGLISKKLLSILKKALCKVEVDSKGRVVKILSYGESTYPTIDAFIQDLEQTRLASNAALVRRLSSRNIREVDNALVSLGKLRDPEQIVSIVEEVFANKGLRLEIDEQRHPYVIRIIRNENQEIIGTRDFVIVSKEKVLVFYSGGISQDGYEGRRLFPLMYQWMAAHDNFRNRFSGWRIKVARPATSSAAKAWWRSGFDVRISDTDTREVAQDISDIKDGRSYDISGRLPEWKEVDKAGEYAALVLRNSKGESFETVFEKIKPYLDKAKVKLWGPNQGIIEVDFFEYLDEAINRTFQQYGSPEEQREVIRLQDLSNDELEKDPAVQELLHSLKDLEERHTLESLLDRLSEDEATGLVHHIRSPSSAEIMLHQMQEPHVTGDERERYKDLLKETVLHKVLIRELIYRWNLSDGESSIISPYTERLPSKASQTDL